MSNVILISRETMTKTQIALFEAKDKKFEIETRAVGGGQWALEVYSAGDGYICEYVGSNGTLDGEEADDLYQWLNADIELVQRIFK